MSRLCVPKITNQDPSAKTSTPVPGAVRNMSGPSWPSIYQDGILHCNDTCWSWRRLVCLCTLVSAWRNWDVCPITGCTEDAREAPIHCVRAAEWHECEYRWHHCFGCCAVGGEGYQRSYHENSGHLWCMRWIVLQCTLVLSSADRIWWTYDRSLGCLAAPKDWQAQGWVRSEEETGKE
jgi:hypothetical protein